MEPQTIVSVAFEMKTEAPGAVEYCLFKCDPSGHRVIVEHKVSQVDDTKPGIAKMNW